jgi:type IV pilus assembly protein PilV
MSASHLNDVRSRARRSGFSLIEVLVSILVLSFGMLGVASLLAASLSGSHGSTLRTQAIVLADDLADRMRANRTTAISPGPNNYEGTAPADNRCRAVHYGHRHAAPVACTPQQLAADDLFDWLAQVAAVLPAGTAVVCIDSTPDDGTAGAPACDGVGGAYAIKEFWNEKPPRGSALPVAQRFSTSVRP